MKLNDLQKIKALRASLVENDVCIEGPCSRDSDMSLMYTCRRRKCIFPCVCKDCVIEGEKQCEEHQILHPGFFDQEKHAITVRSDDFYNINLVRDNFAFDPKRTIEGIKYAGIQRDCETCQKDLQHHQAYHFVHHGTCKFCCNEMHKYENIKTLKECYENMKDRYNDEKLSCHYCNKLFSSQKKKENHVQHMHENTTTGIPCLECNQTFQSKQAREHHQMVAHVKGEEDMCDVCEKTFKSKHALQVHKRSVHNRKSLYCKKCFLGFKINSHLLRHYKLIHGIEMKKYNYYEDCNQSQHCCHKCDFKTVHKQNLVKHLDMMHSTPKLIFECENCNYKTSYKRNFTRHTENVHLQKNKFDCKLCDFSSVYNTALTRHKAEQHGIRAKGVGISRHLYFCDRCDFEAFNEDAVFQHFRTTKHD